MFKNYLRFFFTLAVGLTLIFGVTNAMANPQNKFTGNNSLLGFIGNPTIATDRTAYQSGETVTIVGSGFGKFERVDLVIDSYNALVGRDITLSQWSVYADQKGQFRTAINIDSLSAGSGSFSVKAFGTQGKSVSETLFSAVLVGSADIDQCRNGTSGTDQCTGGNWVNGNLGSSNSSYVEGEFVPYRMRITGVAGDGVTVNTLIIEYDTTQSGKHALDYIGTYNANETNADPCDYAGCPFGGPSTFPIPIDPMVTNGPNGVPGGGDDITQIPGNFTIWGGTITNVTLGTFSGTYAGSSMRQIVITFTSTVTNPVLSWGGHISTRIDWGVGFSAIDISGSPYHMRLISINGGGGNQDRSMSASAILYPALLKIIKDAVPNSPDNFTFTATGPGVTSPFTLDDDAGAPGEDATFNNSIMFSNIQSFGAGNEITITENLAPGWTLQSVVCKEDDGGLGTSTTGSSTSVGLRNAVIRTQEAEVITCTFTNEVVLAAAASIEGVVTNSSGRGLSNVLVRVTDLNNGETSFAITNPFGRYRIGELQTGVSYLVSVTSKRYVFSSDTRVITLNEDAVGLNFIADPE